MKDLLRVRDLRMVDVRKYNGVEDGMESWTFLGYDIVSFDKEGKAVSILADEETKYDVLEEVYSEKYKRKVIDHSGIEIGKVMAKPVSNRNVEEVFLGGVPVTTKKEIQRRLDRQRGFYFLHYNYDKEIGKVKKLGSLKK